MLIADFIKHNKLFFQGKYNLNTKANLLIEDHYSCFVVHCLAMQALMLNKAKAYKPLWLYNPNVSIELLKSYSPNAEQVKLVKPGYLNRLYIVFVALFNFIKIKFKSDILSFTYDKVKYGDIVYDSYLAQYKVGTIRQIDLKVLYLIAQCIYRHESIKKTILKYN